MKNVWHKTVSSNKQQHQKDKDSIFHTYRIRVFHVPRLISLTNTGQQILVITDEILFCWQDQS